MQAYFIVAAALALLASCDLFGDFTYNCRTAFPALIVFVAFAGLRYHTGYDWIAYEDVFRDAPSEVFEQLDFPIVNQLFSWSEMEPGFLLLNVAIKMLGGSLQTLFLVTAAVNGAAIY